MTVKMKKLLEEHDRAGWTWIQLKPKGLTKHEFLAKIKDTPNSFNVPINGKYLFFSLDRDLLLRIARNEVLNHAFPLAKINLPSNKRGEDYVLCLYYKDNSRKHELAERSKQYPGVRYRYWKGD